VHIAMIGRCFVDNILPILQMRESPQDCHALRAK
jgi:hypothetical protein